MKSDIKNSLIFKKNLLELIKKCEKENKMGVVKLTPDTVSNTKFELLNILNKGE